MSEAIDEAELHTVDPDMGWSDVSDEEWREYIFPGNQSIRVRSPSRLRVKRDHSHNGRGSKDSHRVECKHGEHYYIPPGWLAMKFKAPKYSF